MQGRFVMRRLFVVIVAGAAVSGCTSFSLDTFRSTPPPVTVQLDSIPPGADAVTSVGPGCKTPCSVQIPSTNTFSVTFTLPKFQPATIPVTVTVNPGDFTTPATTVIDPNPVVVELQPLGPPPRRVAKRAAPRRAPPAAPPAAPPPAAGSPFPPPGSR
jgi:hypothetical protein